MCRLFVNNGMDEQFTEDGISFDLDKPYLVAPCQINDIDTRPSHPSIFF